MATRKKSGIDDYKWVNYVSQLQDLTTSEFSREFFYNSLVYYVPLKLVNVNVFCAGAVPTYVEPVLADFQSGAWIEMYKVAVDAANFYYWCEEY